MNAKLRRDAETIARKAIEEVKPDEAVRRAHQHVTLGERGYLVAIGKAGRYWDSKGEIDVTALDPEGKNLILGECKYWTEPVGISVLRDLEAKAESAVWERNTRKVWYVLFSAAGFTEGLKEIVVSREDVLLCDEVED